MTRRKREEDERKMKWQRWKQERKMRRRQKKEKRIIERWKEDKRRFLRCDHHTGILAVRTCFSVLLRGNSEALSAGFVFLGGSARQRFLLPLLTDGCCRRRREWEPELICGWIVSIPDYHRQEYLWTSAHSPAGCCSSSRGCSCCCCRTGWRRRFWRGSPRRRPVGGPAALPPDSPPPPCCCPSRCDRLPPPPGSDPEGECREPALVVTWGVWMFAGRRAGLGRSPPRRCLLLTGTLASSAACWAQSCCRCSGTPAACRAPSAPLKLHPPAQHPAAPRRAPSDTRAGAENWQPQCPSQRTSLWGSSWATGPGCWTTRPSVLWVGWRSGPLRLQTPWPSSQASPRTLPVGPLWSSPSCRCTSWTVNLLIWGDFALLRPPGVLAAWNCPHQNCCMTTPPSPLQDRPLRPPLSWESSSVTTRPPWCSWPSLWADPLRSSRQHRQTSSSWCSPPPPPPPPGLSASRRSLCSPFLRRRRLFRRGVPSPTALRAGAPRGLFWGSDRAAPRRAPPCPRRRARSPPWRARRLKKTRQSCELQQEVDRQQTTLV